MASDHAGFELKEYLKEFLINNGFKINDIGVYDGNSVDYPDYGIKLAEKISKNSKDYGLIICGTGIGMSMVVNKFPNVRGALCHDLYTARLSRAHNDANILILGGRVLGKGLAEEIVRVWVDTPFEGGRHGRRVEKINHL
ncbi:MAG: ribose 5-phosphate isomerase B [Nitrospinaceae bacterium]